MSVSVVSILTADHAAQLAEENARLECRIQELEAEVEAQKALVVAARVDVSAANHALAAEQSKNRRRVG